MSILWNWSFLLVSLQTSESNRVYGTFGEITLNQINVECVQCAAGNHGSCIATKQAMIQFLDEPEKHCSCLANDHKQLRFSQSEINKKYVKPEES